ncbi:hypothetical protein GCM10009527_070800 [Actinomadura nitritigenes]|uniref:CHRD domain-containing protein n=1 Tax=Actinomadura nitritigenes TaxID=134602 RepID=A0ABS3R9G5_9ACTN|nr:hypothetical protein [Actinomadura nitritigenes]MBO2442801.1 hypothetical protein [Actinomadura nitritigenes]
MALALGGAAGLALTAAAPAASAPAASAGGGPADARTVTYQARLRPLNHQTGSGRLTLRLRESTATITEQYSGLAATLDGRPYPHLQHIHGGARGMCPPASADRNRDGVVSTAEGTPYYGRIQATLSVKGDITPQGGTDLRNAPKGPSVRYQRTITLSPAAVASLHKGIAVVVVHGDDPRTLGRKARNEKSELVPSLPLAVTSPALCGVLRAIPAGGAVTGTGSTAGTGRSTGAWLLGAGAGLAGAGALARVLFVRRRNRAAFRPA